MKKIFLIFLLLDLLGGWVEKSNEKEKTEIYYKKGNTKYSLNDFEGAISDYSKAIELNSKNAKAYCNRDSAKDEVKDSEGAILDFNKAIELNPKYSFAYYI